MADVLKESHSFTCTPRVHLLTTIPAFACPGKAGTHLPTPEGRKAELASALVCSLWWKQMARHYNVNDVNKW